MSDDDGNWWQRGWQRRRRYVTYEEMFQMSQEFQQAQADLDGKIDQVRTDVQNLVSKISASPSAAEFQTELDALKASAGKLGDVDTTAQATLNPQPAPAPAPTPTDPNAPPTTP